MGARGHLPAGRLRHRGTLRLVYLSMLCFVFAGVDFTIVVLKGIAKVEHLESGGTPCCVVVLREPETPC